MERTHYRKAFNSPYLSSADIDESLVVTIDHVALEPDHTHKTKELFNTAYFAETEIRPGQKLKPMILNATNSEVVREISKSKYLEDWHSIKVVVYVDHNVKGKGGEIVDGLRLRAYEKATLTPDNAAMWESAKAAYLRDKNLDKVLARVSMSDEHQKQLREECDGVPQRTAEL